MLQTLGPSQQSPVGGNQRVQPTQSGQSPIPLAIQGETPAGGLHGTSLTQTPGTNPSYLSNPVTDGRHGDSSEYNQTVTPMITSPPPQLPYTQVSSNLYSQSSTSTGLFTSDSMFTEPPPLKPVFGVSLEDLLKRDGSATPLVVYQCLQAVDLFGLEVEGIYRLSGSATHVTKLRTVFDNGEFSKYLSNTVHVLIYHRLNTGGFPQPRTLLP